MTGRFLTRWATRSISVQYKNFSSFLPRSPLKTTNDRASAWPWLTASNGSRPATRNFRETWHCGITLMLSYTFHFLLESDIHNAALHTKIITRFWAHLERKYVHTKRNEKRIEINNLNTPCIIIWSSINQNLMYRFPYTKSSCLSNTPTRFGTRRRHLQGVPSQLVHHVVGELLETIWRTEKLTVEMALPEERVDERRNASECCSNSLTWLTENGAFTVGSTKAK